MFKCPYNWTWTFECIKLIKIIAQVCWFWFIEELSNFELMIENRYWAMNILCMRRHVILGKQKNHFYYPANCNLWMRMFGEKWMQEFCLKWEGEGTGTKFGHRGCWNTGWTWLHRHWPCLAMKWFCMCNAVKRFLSLCVLATKQAFSNRYYDQPFIITQN